MDWLQYIKDHWRTFVGAGILAVMGPVLAASEKSLKSLIDEWFEACSVVVQIDNLVSRDDGHFIPIRLFVLGNPPKEAELVVAADKAIFTDLQFIQDLSSNNRALHSLAKPSRKAGGATLPIGGTLAPKKNVSEDLKPFKSKFDYSFRAHIPEDQVEEVRKKNVHYAAFVSFPNGEQHICRVETMTIFNWLVGGSASHRFIALVVLVIVLTGAATLLRSK